MKATIHIERMVDGKGRHPAVLVYTLLNRHEGPLVMLEMNYCGQGVGLGLEPTEAMAVVSQLVEAVRELQIKENSNG